MWKFGLIQTLKIWASKSVAMSSALSAVEEIELKTQAALVGHELLLLLSVVDWSYSSLKWHTKAVAVRLHLPRIRTFFNLLYRKSATNPITDTFETNDKKKTCRRAVNQYCGTDTVGFVWIGEFDFNTLRVDGNFWIGEENVADLKIYPDTWGQGLRFFKFITALNSISSYHSL